MAARVNIVAALGKDRVIGKDNQLLWHIPEDLKRFKLLTLGHPVIMGRKTLESIIAGLGKPLPGRTNIVVTRDPEWKYEGVVVCHSLEEALGKAQEIDQEEIFIGGGAEIYTQSLPFTNRLYLTLIEGDHEGDTFFPEYGKYFKKVLKEEKGAHSGIKYRWLDLEREKPLV